jgi:hypothetical protein
MCPPSLPQRRPHRSPVRRASGPRRGGHDPYADVHAFGTSIPRTVRRERSSSCATARRRRCWNAPSGKCDAVVKCRDRIRDVPVEETQIMESARTCDGGQRRLRRIGSMRQSRLTIAQPLSFIGAWRVAAR